MNIIYTCIIFLIVSINVSFGQSDFEVKYSELLSLYNNQGNLDYQSLANESELLNEIFQDLQNTRLDINHPDEYRSLLINAYNFIVIHQICSHYPVNSVKNIPGFFTKKHPIGAEKLSLDQIEKLLLKTQDPRIHMALVCGAKSCPVLKNTPYDSKQLNQQLDEQSKFNLEREDFIQINEKEIRVNKIFDWYQEDFQGSNGINNFILKYSDQKIEVNTTSYLPYDWSLNEKKGIGLNTTDRFYASNLYGKGQFEINFFNNYYSQVDEDLRGDPISRYDFLTSLVQLTYGWSESLNLGVDLRFRSVSQNLEDPSLKFESLQFSNTGTRFIDGIESGYQRVGLTALNLRVKYKPFRQFRYLTTQQTISIPLLFKEEGKGFIDWTGFSFQHQFIYDREIGRDFAIYLEGGFLIENINKAIINRGDGFNQYTLPLSAIFSYFPSKDWTIYALYNVAPQLYHSVINLSSFSSYGYYQQLGIAMKYFIHPALQVETLITGFYSGNEGRTAATYNFGLRYFYR